jgi:hypothetical protein
VGGSYVMIEGMNSRWGEKFEKLKFQRKSEDDAAEFKI